jgi:hypothetical protein
MTKDLARIALALIAALGVAALALIPISTSGGIWPIWSGNHTVLALLLAGTLGWMALGAGVLFLGVCGICWLFIRAGWYNPNKETKTCFYCNGAGKVKLYR